MNTIHTLDIAGLEQVYDRLATAIDEAGPEKSELFLVKLALLNVHDFIADMHELFNSLVELVKDLHNRCSELLALGIADFDLL